MTQKHFVAIAATIKSEVDGHRYMIVVPAHATYDSEQHAYAVTVLQATAERLADQFQVFNSNFNRTRFLTACGF
jgi:hypothetical protein